MSPVNSRKNKRVITVMMALLILFLCFSLWNAHASSPVSLSAKPGFEGLFKKGNGIPLEIVLENKTGRPLSGSLLISGGMMEHSVPVRLTQQSIKREWIFLYPKMGSNLHLQFSSGNDFTLQKEIKVIPFIRKRGFVVYISEETGMLRSVRRGFPGRERFFEVTPQGLWNIWKGYEQAEYVILDASAVEFMTPLQLRALKRYVLSGGALFITGKLHPEIYKHGFMQDLLPVRIKGIKRVSPGFLYPGSPQAGLLSFDLNSENVFFHRIKDIPFWAEVRKGEGRVLLLSFDPANEAFHPLMGQEDSLRAGHRRINRLVNIAGKDWSGEIRGLYLNCVTWHSGYLFCLVPIGFIGKKGYRKISLMLLGILLIAGSLVSLGMLNGENQLKVATVSNVYPGERDVFLQSMLSTLSTENGRVNMEFQGGHVYPSISDKQSAINTITLTETDAKQISFSPGMLNRDDILWEQFNESGSVLEADLEVHNNTVKGDIANVSKYSIENPFIRMKGSFYPIPSIKGGEHISIDIKLTGAAYTNFPEEYLRMVELFRDMEDVEGPRDLKIIGFWEKPALTLNKSNLLIQEEKNILIYHM